MSGAAAPLAEATPELQALLARATSPEAVDAWLSAHAVPLVEESSNTFIWRGEADAVAVEHRVVGLPAPLPLSRVPGSDVWYAMARLPRGARMEYRLLVRRGGDVVSVLDPRNPGVARGPAGEMSVLSTPGYSPPDWTLHHPEVVPGRLTELRLRSRWLRREAMLTVYTPARLGSNRRYPLLIVHDGPDFLAHAALGTVLDNLMHRRRIADTIVAFTQPLDRMQEYTAAAAHSRFVNQELVPELERTLPLIAAPGARVLLGASLGAVASLAAAVRAPGMYGGLMLESGSFRAEVPQLGRTPPRLRAVVRFVRALQERPVWVARRIFQAFGAYEPLAAVNREMSATLCRMADELQVVEGLDGHNWTNWRDRLLDGLRWLLPPR